MLAYDATGSIIANNGETSIKSPTFFETNMAK